ncbi:MAG: glycosyltransferase [Pseudomonadales bacterium]|nr:glycosyltransferase [Pseudomonadales bacterium]
MKLLFFINSLSSGGAERVITKLASHYGDANHEASLVTLTSLDSDYYSVSPSVTRISLGAGGLSTGVVNAVANNLRRHSKLRQLIRRMKPDAIIAFMPTANVLAVLAAGKTAVIVSERVHPAFDPASKLRFWFKRFAYRRASQVVVLSQISSDWLQEKMGIEPCVIIPNGIALPLPCEQPNVDPSAYIDAEARLILVVGRVSDQKQPFVALAAFEQFAAQSQNWHLVLIGSGDLDNTLKQAVQQSPHANCIHLVPRAGNISAWYKRANIFLSTAKYEGSPNALMEAMAHGCPVLALDCPTGPADLIDNNSNGLLLPLEPTTDQAERISQALLALGNNDTLRKRLGERAANITNTHSDQTFFQRWTTLLPMQDAN